MRFDKKYSPKNAKTFPELLFCTSYTVLVLIFNCSICIDNFAYLLTISHGYL